MERYLGFQPPINQPGTSQNRAYRRWLASPAPVPYKPALLNGFEGFAAMKKGIHPSYHFVNVVMNDGTTYKTRTTWGEPDQKLQLDIDPSTHPAWTGGQQQLLDRGGRLTRFNKRFGDYVKK
jgi:large subunit ribosomal protein L31